MTLMVWREKIHHFCLSLYIFQLHAYFPFHFYNFRYKSIDICENFWLFVQYVHGFWEIFKIELTFSWNVDVHTYKKFISTFFDVKQKAKLESFYVCSPQKDKIYKNERKRNQKEFFSSQNLKTRLNVQIRRNENETGEETVARFKWFKPLLWTIWILWVLLL